jgi:hypothetical protein
MKIDVTVSETHVAFALSRSPLVVIGKIRTVLHEASHTETWPPLPVRALATPATGRGPGSDVTRMIALSQERLSR